MDIIDKTILNIVQKEFPLEPEPFKWLAKKVGISPDDMLGRINRMKKEKIIRRIGAVFDTERLGFSSTLCAASVPEGALQGFVASVNAYEGVSHNYLRDHRYNVWFTVIAPTKEKIDNFLADLRESTGIQDILTMPVKRKFKVNAQFYI